MASVDTYLRFADAANRLELGTLEPEGISDVVGDITQTTARRVVEGKVQDASRERGSALAGANAQPAGHAFFARKKLERARS
jgi:hypothetical protein